MALAEHDEPVSSSRPEDLPERSGIVVGRRTEQQILIPVAQGLGNAGKQIKHERVGNMTLLMRAEVKRDSNRVGPLTPQFLGVAVDRVALLMSDGKHSGPGRLPDERAVVQRPRNGGFRYVRKARYIVHCDGAFFCHRAPDVPGTLAVSH